jgi:hypothetical protein
MADIGSSDVEVSTSVFSVVYFSIDVATRELAIANTSSGRRKIRHFCHREFGKLAGLIAPRGDTQVLKDSGPKIRCRSAAVRCCASLGRGASSSFAVRPKSILTFEIPRVIRGGWDTAPTMFMQGIGQRQNMTAVRGFGSRGSRKIIEVVRSVLATLRPDCDMALA